MSETVTRIRPAKNQVLIRPFPRNPLLASGIMMPEQAEQPSQEGEVIEVGIMETVKGRRVPAFVSVGEHVFYAKYGTEKFDLEGTEYVLVPQELILFVFTG